MLLGPGMLESGTNTVAAPKKPHRTASFQRLILHSSAEPHRLSRFVTLPPLWNTGPHDPTNKDPVEYTRSACAKFGRAPERSARRADTPNRSRAGTRPISRRNVVVRTSETGRVPVSAPGAVIRWSGSWDWRPYESGFTAAGRLCWRSRVLRRWMLHTRSRSASVEAAESCGTATSVVTTVPLPCAQTPLTAHGSPTATHNDRQKSPRFQQKSALGPQRPQPPMCNTEDSRTHQSPHTTLMPPQTQ